MEMMHNGNEFGTVRTAGREGFALATTILIVLVLSVLAVGVAWIAASEKKTTFAEDVHIRSVFAADAGGEAGINFIRLAESPPRIIDFADATVANQGNTALQGSQNYAYDARYLRRIPRPGWGMDYMDFDYRIGSDGSASRDGRASVDVVVSRLFRVGY
jgi:Tfp pilus assembly protein PilX